MTAETAVPEVAGRTRTVLVGFLGSVVRRMGNWLPIAGTVELMGHCGHDPSSVRTGVSRLKQKGWIEPEVRFEKRGYRLTGEALAALTAGDEVIWHVRQPAALSDGWCVVNFSLPEAERTRRHQLRAHLTSSGFGNIGAAVWIAPARMLPAAERVIADVDVAEHCAIFVGQYAAGQDLAALARSSWDLDAIEGRYRDFIAAHQEMHRSLREHRWIDERQAFVWYVGLIDRWRKLPFKDPGLPLELVGPRWPAAEAAGLFEELVTALEGRALAHAAAYWPHVVRA